MIGSERLESIDLLGGILDHGPRLVSFDVFDTLLWRPCRRPVDLFRRLGDELHRKGLLRDIDPAGFAKLRIHAEQAVRFSGQGPEVTHLEITAELSGRLGHARVDALAEDEFHLERDHLFAYPEMFELLVRLDREGIPFALCSDMYFSSAQILSFLENAAGRLGMPLPEPAVVLVSGENRTGKSDRLFDLLVEKTGVPAAHIVHIGDNPVSDVEKPRSKGIRAIHLPRTCETAESILDAEEKYLVAPKNFQSDFGLAATRKELLAESLLAYDGKLTHRTYGAFVAGPVFAAFAAWVVLECRRHGIRRVDCILREGHFLSRLLDRAKTALGVELEVRTILSSRFCLRAAGLVDATEDAMVDFLRNVRQVDVQADLFEYLGLFEKTDTAELVKIDPKSIGVGQYQHDVDQSALKRSLDDTVVSCVNHVGVELNTASANLLGYVSGLNSRVAQGIVEFRNANGAFESREQLMKVPGLGPKAFEQAAGFLRIRNGKNPLDASAVHPERYPLVDRMAGDLGCSVGELLQNPARRSAIKLESYITPEVGLPTLQDIVKELAKPGRDPRKQFEVFAFSEEAMEVKDLKPGMKLPGIVTNVAAFGAFIDVGVHQDGLAHISQLSDQFVKNPSDVVKVGQKVMATVLEVDLERKRISLSLKTNPEIGAAPRGRSGGGGGQMPKRRETSAPPQTDWFTAALNRRH